MDDMGAKLPLTTGVVGDSAVHVEARPGRAVVGDGRGEVGAEVVDHPIMAGRNHQVQSALLAIEVPRSCHSGRTRTRTATDPAET